MSALSLNQLYHHAALATGGAALRQFKSPFQMYKGAFVECGSEKKKKKKWNINKSRGACTRANTITFVTVTHECKITAGISSGLLSLNATSTRVKITRRFIHRTRRQTHVRCVFPSGSGNLHTAFRIHGKFKKRGE